MADRLIRAKNDHGVFGEDRISQLPTVILICILSFLKLDEAARTSVLSKNWRDVWKFTARLDFDGSILLRNKAIMRLSKGKQRIKYLNWVNKVLKSVKSNKEMGLDEFRLCFELFRSTGTTINNWLEYAFERRVQRLEMDFSKCRWSSATYCFPRLLDPSTEELSEDPDTFNKTLVITNFTYLRSLSLSRVGVNGELLEFILRKFPFLESLKVCFAINLIGVNVCGTSLALKHLEISNCWNLKSMVVRDTCIVSLTVSCWETDLVLENNPMLVHVCVSEICELRPSVFSCLSRLSGVEVLTLFFSSYSHLKNGAKLIEEGPRLTKVKQLILVVEEVYNDGFIHLLSLMGLFPNLEKFVFKVNNISPGFKNYWEYEKEKPSSFALEHLQVFEFDGYCGRASEDGVIVHVQENARLQRITIKLSELNGLRFLQNRYGRCCICRFRENFLNQKFPHDPSDSCGGEVAVVKGIRDNARVRAHHLKGGIPSSIRVDIL